MKKKMYRAAWGFLATVLMAFTLLPNIFADHAGLIEQAPQYFTPEYQEFLKSAEEESTGYVAQKKQLRVTDSKVLNVPLYQQENGHFCGPASVQMVISYLTGTKIEQETLKNDMGTDSSGTMVYKIQQRLNQTVSSNTYNYFLPSDVTFSNRLVYSIEKNRPIVCHVVPSRLTSSSTSTSTGHYLVATGYHAGFSGSTYVETCYYNDPYNDSRYYGKYTCSISEMSNAMKDYYISA